MSLIIGILLAIFVFFVVVFIHEMGHFLVARWSGVKVHEFGIGIPPKLKRIFKDKKGTEWTLNWLPLGGFVRLKGEDIAAPESRDRDALPQAPWWKQVAILLAGVTMNFLLAGLLFGFLFYRGTEPLTIHIRELVPDSLLSHVGNGTRLIAIHSNLADAEKAGVIMTHPGFVLDPIENSAAALAGVQSGDIAISVDGQTLLSPEDVSDIIAKNPTVSHLFAITRGGENKTISITPKDGKIGAYVVPNISAVRYQYPLLQSLGYGMQEVGQQIGFSLRSLGAIVTTSFSKTATDEQKREATQGIGGPVAIGRVFVGLANHGVQVRAVIIMMAMISLSLGVFNLLPLPALDGGRIFVILVNRIIHLISPRFKITPHVEQLIHSFGFVLLIVASILITWKDIFLH